MPGAIKILFEKTAYLFKFVIIIYYSNFMKIININSFELLIKSLQAYSKFPKVQKYYIIYRFLLSYLCIL